MGGGRGGIVNGHFVLTQYRGLMCRCYVYAYCLIIGSACISKDNQKINQLVFVMFMLQKCPSVYDVYYLLGFI